MSMDTFIDEWYKIDMALFKKYNIQFCVCAAGTRFVADYYLSSFRLDFGVKESQGIGTKALKLLCKLAKKHGVSIALQCAPRYNIRDMTYREHESAYWRVIDVYKRAGFKLTDWYSYKQALNLYPAYMDFNLPGKLRGHTVS